MPQPQHPRPSLRFADGGIVPGSGRGDKIPAKYEPGEFVVSNDMIDDNPGLREQLAGLRAETLAARGKTVEEADAKALRYHGGRPSLRAGGGFDPDGMWRGDNRPVAPTNGANTVSPSARLDALKARAAEIRAATPQAPQLTTSPGAGVPNNGIPYVMPPEPIKATTSPGAAPTAAAPPAAAPRAATPPPALDVERLRSAGVPPPTSLPLPPDQAAAYDASPEGRATKAQALKESRGYFQGRPNAAPTAEPAAPTPTTKASTLRNVASAVGNGILYGGAALGGAAVARGASGIGAPGAGSSATVGERQSGDSASSTQIPIGGNSPAPAAQPYNFWTDSEVGRNTGNTVNAVAPLGGLTMAARVPGAASKAFGVADAALGGLSAGIHNERTSASAAPDPRNPYADANAAKIAASDAQNKAADAQGKAAPAAPPDYTNDVTRNGNEYSGKNIRGDITINGFAPGAGLGRGSEISAQNMRAADNLAATDSLRSQGAALSAALSGQPGGSGMPAMPQTRHSGNDWEARNNLRNLEVSASSPTAGRGARRAYQNALAMDIAARTGSDPGSVARTTAQANMFGSKATADASKENSRNTLRGTMYTADATLGGKRMEQQYKMQQQQMRAAIFQAAGNDPAKAAALAAQYGMDAKDFTDMAQANQTRDHHAAANARKRLEGLAVRKGEKPGETVVDQGRVARLESTLGKMAPGWQHMNEREQAKHLGKAEASVNILEGLNDRRNTSFWQTFGVDGDSMQLDNIPDEITKGAKLGVVGLKEGATTADAERKDYVITTQGGHKLYIPRNKVNQGELEFFKSRGVDISGVADK